MSCKVKLLSKVSMINVSDFEIEALSDDLDNILQLIEEVKKVGSEDGILYEYPSSEMRNDYSTPISFEPFLNTQSKENHFCTKVVISE